VEEVGGGIPGKNRARWGSHRAKERSTDVAQTSTLGQRVEGVSAEKKDVVRVETRGKRTGTNGRCTKLPPAKSYTVCPRTLLGRDLLRERGEVDRLTIPV